MFMQIIQHTPLWVWVLLIALAAAGLAQTRSRRISVQRATLLPTVLLALSLLGVTTTFEAQHVALPIWAAAVAAALGFGQRIVVPRGASWSDATRLLHVPGSVLPLALIAGLFTTKYTAGVLLAMQPTLASDVKFAVLCAACYGVFSGLFAARALWLWRLARAGVARHNA